MPSHELDSSSVDDEEVGVLELLLLDMTPPPEVGATTGAAGTTAVI